MTPEHLTKAPPSSARTLLLGSICLALAGASSAPAQHASTLPCIPTAAPTSSSAPAFTYDVASIRPHPPENGIMSFRDQPHDAKLAMVGVSMKDLIEDAYGVSGFQVIGGPEWVDSAHYDVEARSDSSTNDQLAKLNDCDAHHAKQLMLQALLADRLKLTIHRGTKQTEGYTLIVAKGGPMFQVSPPPPPSPDASAADPTGGMSGRSSRRGNSVSATNYPIENLAGWLSSELSGPVQDNTGLTGLYDFKLKYSDDDPSATPPSGQNAPFPALFTALQEQLGLKLLTGKVPIQTIVIDHIEPYSEN